MSSISQILRAFHQPDRGHHGACAYCAHCRSLGEGSLAHQRCAHPGHAEQTTDLARSRGGHCGPHADHQQFANPHRQAAQAQLAL